MSPLVKEEDRCLFTYADGRRCRMPKILNHDTLCFSHWQQQERMNEAQKASEEILDPAQRLDTANGINKALTNVFRLTAANRLPTRNAAILAYIGQLLICTLPQLNKENEAYGEMLSGLLKVGLGGKKLFTPEDLTPTPEQVEDNLHKSRLMFMNFLEKLTGAPSPITLIKKEVRRRMEQSDSPAEEEPEVAT